MIINQAKWFVLLQNGLINLCRRYKKNSNDFVREITTEIDFFIANCKIIYINVNSNDLVEFYSMPHVSERRSSDWSYSKRVDLIITLFGTLPKDINLHTTELNLDCSLFREKIETE